MALPGGVAIVPRLWIGSNTTCDVCRRNLSFVCINVGLTEHTNDSRCNFIPLCTAPGGYVSNTQLVAVQRLVINAFGQTGTNILLHCSDALTYSPLAAALWLMQRYVLTLPQAYQWVKTAQPQAKDLSALAPPRAA
jgi:hypothetical protein